MAAYGTATIQPVPTIIAITTDTYGPTSGSMIDVANLLTLGTGGTPVDPKRFVNVGGTAVPIQ